MRTALAGPRRAAQAWLWVGVLAFFGSVAGCSGNPATGALQVLVNLEPGLISRCVKVTATDGTTTHETKPILLAGKTSPLHVAVYADGLIQPVTVQAIGYRDDPCTMLSGEVSETAAGTFSAPRVDVSVTLRPAGTADGGFKPDGGSDGGQDAGVDNDGDGSPQPADCDDTDPAVFPAAPESCTNNLDDNCDGLTDCQQPSCAGFFCTGGGTCAGGVCVASTEVLCTDGIDNDGDTLVDCLDPDCVTGTTCSDNNGCTLGDQCVSDGGCEKTSDTVCTTTLACYAAAGVCLPDAGAMCQFTPMAGSCEDGLSCTVADTCTAGTCTAGTARTCTTPGNVCLAATGTCQEPDGGCTYAPLANGGCDDGVNCTVNDACDGDGGCAGTTVPCPTPSQCHTATTGCGPDGGCLFNSATGLACDGGVGAGTCTGAFACKLNGLFPYTQSNFVNGDLANDGGIGLTVSGGDRTLDTDGPTLTGGMPPYTIFTSGGVSTLLIQVTSLSVAATRRLTVQGARPVIFAVLGDVSISGTIRAENPGSPAACGNGGNGGAGGGAGLGGGGGGGFGSDGADGGVRTAPGNGAAGAANGVDTIVPLRGGCSGGVGSDNNGPGGGAAGPGGGAVQISASGSLTVTSTGRISARGLGGSGGASNDHHGGGGGSGGALLLEGFTIQLDNGSWLSANGGGGGGGRDGNTAGDGADGSENSSTPANGGTQGGSLGGDGGKGAARAATAEAGFNSASHGSGGGGGGVGRIRLNAAVIGGSCTVTGSNQSPTATSNLTTGCP